MERTVIVSKYSHWGTNHVQSCGEILSIWRFQNINFKHVIMF